jgi:hypothetical protein
MKGGTAMTNFRHSAMPLLLYVPMYDMEIAVNNRCKRK